MMKRRDLLLIAISVMIIYFVFSLLWSLSQTAMFIYKAESKTLWRLLGFTILYFFWWGFVLFLTYKFRHSIVSLFLPEDEEEK